MSLWDGWPAVRGEGWCPDPLPLPLQHSTKQDKSLAASGNASIRTQVMTHLKSPNLGGEQHTFQFRGCHAHPDLFHFLYEGKINSTEFVLALIVECLVQSKGDGCFASNTYLGNILHMTPIHTSRMVSKLLSLGILVLRKKQPRVLETSWSRINRLNINVKGGKHTDLPYEYIRRDYTRTGRKPAASGEKKPMGFIEVKDKPPITITLRHKALSRTFHKVVCDKTCYKKKINLLHWAKEFASIDKKTGDPSRVDKVFRWYIKQDWNNKWIPKAFSARSFKEKFDRIEDSMKRGMTYSASEVKITDQAKRAADLINNQRWDRGGHNILPAVQITIDSYTEFRKKLSTLKIKDQMLSLFAKEVLGQLQSPVEFAVNWFEGVRGNWEWNQNWHGNLLKHTFKVDDKQFQEMGRNISMAYCSSYGRWEKLMEVYRREN